MSERQLFHVLLAAVFVVSAVVFTVLWVVSAPYGKHFRRGWGAGIGARPAWVVMELPAVLTVALCLAVGRPPASIIPVVFAVMWQLHYIQRTFLFPFLVISSKAKRVPVLLVLFAVVFNVVNGYLNGRWLFGFAPVYGDKWLQDPRFVIGLAMFLAGHLVNIHSDHLLRRLRRGGGGEYKMPRGGFFEYVSCANYFGELVEWVGWAVATWSLPGLAFAVFTAANLVPRARAHHRWYRETFPGYPRRRKAIIPFIY